MSYLLCQAQASHIKILPDVRHRILYKLCVAKRVAFDAGEERQHALSLSDPDAGNFGVLGGFFDTTEFVSAAVWKLRTLLRTRCYLHFLSFLKYTTSTTYHATRAVLSRLDALRIWCMILELMGPSLLLSSNSLLLGATRLGSVEFGSWNFVGRGT